LAGGEIGSGRVLNFRKKKKRQGGIPEKKKNTDSRGGKAEGRNLQQVEGNQGSHKERRYMGGNKSF